MSLPDVLIVGGGVIGAAAARSLATAGVAVQIIDSGTEDGIATQASAGMLAPLVETELDDPLLRICVRSRDLYSELAPTLLEETGVDVGMWSDGILKVALTDDEEAAARGLIAWQRQQGLNSEWLSAVELRERCPGISKEARGALLAPEDGALQPLALLEALLVSATRYGARISARERVEAIEIEQGRVTGVRTNRATHRAETVLLAAGCWSGRVEGLPRPLSVEPVRGQVLGYDWPAGEPPAILYSGRGYLLQRGKELLAGSTMEHVGFDASVTPEGRAQIAETAARLYPALADAPVRRSWAGLRPATPDGRPIVGPDLHLEGLWYATGHGRNGILLAAVTGEILVNLLTENTLEYDLSPLEPGRFWTA